MAIRQLKTVIRLDSLTVLELLRGREVSYVDVNGEETLIKLKEDLICFTRQQLKDFEHDVRRGVYADFNEIKELLND